MAATAFQLARARAQQFHREYRVYVGPRRAYVTAGLFTIGEPTTLPETTVLTGRVRATSTTIPVRSTAGLPTSGMVMIMSDPDVAGGAHFAPAGAPPAAGWFSYTGTTATSLTGVKFEWGNPDHRAGGIVTVWHNITDRVDAGSIRISEIEDLPFYDWTASIAGTRYNSDLMMPDCTVLIQERLTPNGSFGTYTPWLTAAVGYVRTWNSEGDKDGVRRWSATVESVSTYVRNHRITARRYGRVNLSESASVEASAALGDPSLEPKEFLYGLGSTAADNLVDGNPDTGYISATAPVVSDIVPSGTGSAQLIIEEVQIKGPTGASTELQWVVVRLPTYSDRYNTRGLNVKEYCLTNRLTVFQPDNDSAPIPTANYIRLPDVTLTSDNPILVLCRNRETFDRYFAVENAQVFDWRFLEGYGGGLPSADFRLDPNDWLQLRERARDLGRTEMRDMVVWGVYRNPWANVHDHNAHSSHWNGSNTVALGGAGTSIRRKQIQQDTNQHSDWEINSTPIPGMDRAHTEPVWIDLDLGRFTVTLAEDITSSRTGAIAVSDVGPLDPVGTIQIDSEQMAYTGVDADAGTINVVSRGAGGTAATSHIAGANVFQVGGFGDWSEFYGVGSLGAHRLHPVSSLELVRRDVRDDGGSPIVPLSYEIWASTQENPRHPGESNYRLDWLGGGPIQAVDNRDEALVLSHGLWPPALRARHVMLVIREMSDRGRVKLNEVRVWQTLWTRADEDGNVPTTYSDIRGVFYDLLREVLEPSEILLERDGLSHTPSEITIGEGRLGEILAQLCEETMTVIRFTRDGQVRLELLPSVPGGPRPAVEATLTAEYLRSPHTAMRPSKITLGQMVVNVETPEGNVYTGRYPPQPGPGEIERLTLRRFIGSTSEANAIAEALFWQSAERADSFTFATLGPAEWLQAGMRVLVEDYSDETGVELVNARVVSVEHSHDGERFEVVRWVMP
jgi:hypothetical protein